MPKLRLKIAIWSGPASSWGQTFLGDKSIDQRFARLTEVLDKARADWLDTSLGIENPDTPVLKIFVAPESTLIRSGNARAFDFDELRLEGEHFTKKFETLSRGLLLVPGTAVWKKPATPERMMKLEQRAEGAFRERTTEFYQHKWPDSPGSVHQDKAKTDVDAFQKKLVPLHAQPDTAFIGRSVSYIYHDGERRLKYYKQGEDKKGGNTTEIRDADKKMHRGAPPSEGKKGLAGIKFIPGHQDGRFTVELGGGRVVRCGVEVCVDHVQQQLKFSRDGQNLHLHFLVSDTTYLNKDYVAAEAGGYVVHACTNYALGDRGVSGLYDHAAKLIPANKEEKMLDSLLLYYARDLELPA